MFTPEELRARGHVAWVGNRSFATHDEAVLAAGCCGAVYCLNDCPIVTTEATAHINYIAFHSEAHWPAAPELPDFIVERLAHVRPEDSA